MLLGLCQPADLHVAAYALAVILHSARGMGPLVPPHFPPFLVDLGVLAIETTFLACVEARLLLPYVQLHVTVLCHAELCAP
jgi:hypothetical protein